LGGVEPAALEAFVVLHATAVIVNASTTIERITTLAATLWRCYIEWPTN
jgi:hypothetical protein